VGGGGGGGGVAVIHVDRRTDMTRLVSLVLFLQLCERADNWFEIYTCEQGTTALLEYCSGDLILKLIESSILVKEAL